MMSDLPKGWSYTSLKNIAELIMGQSPPSSTYNTKCHGLPFFQGKAEFGDFYPMAVKYCSSPIKVAEIGDILISVRAPVGPTNLCKEKSCIGRGLAALRPSSEIITKYLFYYLRNIEDWLSTQGTGSTFTAITKEDLENIEVILAPLNEQRRIVAKLEKLLGKVDACKERLEKIPIILKRFRQSVLSAACSGRLTADWREKNPDVELNEADEELPKRWLLITVKNLADSIEYGFTASASDSQIGPKFLRITDIQNGIVNWDTVPFCRITQSKLPKYLLESGDIVFARTGATTGKSFLIESCPEAIFASYLIRVKPSKIVLPAFLYLFFQSKSYWEQISENISGSAQPNCNASKLSSLRVPFPPLPEQQEIVRRVGELFKIADGIEERYKKARGYVDKLTQAILAKAFRGELVPQDPNDEPASVLLERIREERGKKADKSQTGKTKNQRRQRQLEMDI